MFVIDIKRFAEHSAVKKPNVAGTEPSTISNLNIYSEDDPNKSLFKCFVLENGGESTDKSGQDKRILPGDYSLYKTPSSVFLPEPYKGHAISLYRKNEKNDYFKNRRIHIHIGNYPQDSLGCLLPAYVYKKEEGRTYNSTQCTKDLYKLLYSLGLENCVLRITEIGQ